MKNLLQVGRIYEYKAYDSHHVIMIKIISRYTTFCDVEVINATCWSIVYRTGRILDWDEVTLSEAYTDVTERYTRPIELTIYDKLCITLGVKE